MCWAARKATRQDGRALTRALLLAGLATAAVARDLMPRQLAPGGAAEVRFGQASDVHGWAADDSPVVMPRLESLVLAGDATGTRPVERGCVTLQGLSAGGLDDLAAELSQWLGKPLTEAGLDRMLEVILRHHDDHGLPMIDVWVPPQAGADGRLNLELAEGRIGAVGMSPLTRFNDPLVRRGLHLREGDRLTTRALQADLDWLGRNPFRSVELFVAPGEDTRADLLLQVHEQRPWRGYAGYDNTGTASLGGNRWFAGANWGNALGLDHVAGYQFTMADSLETLQAHSLSWEIPLHRLHHFIRLTGAWAEASADERQAGLTVNSEGTNWLASALYGTPLPRIAGWRHELRGGFEFKHADNFILFGQTQLPRTAVEIAQFRAEWEGRGPLWGGKAELRADLVASPGDLTTRNDAAAFAAFRPDADPTYGYVRIEGAWLAPLPGDWSFRSQATGQLASGALLPTEQLGLGGSDTVRGHEEREQLADSGYALTAELRTPPVTWEKHRAQLQGLVFLDHGRGWLDGSGSSSLTGLGTGLRLAVGDHTSARLDVAWPLDGGEGARVHAGVMIGF